MASYRHYKCAGCKKRTKDVRVTSEMTFGNPLYICGHCGQLNYDPFIFEPALLKPEKMIQDGQKEYNSWLGILYVFGLIMSITISSIVGGVGGLFIFVIIVVLVGILRKILEQKKEQVTIERYQAAINASICRLEANEEYAKQIIYLQGNEEGSAWSKRVFSNSERAVFQTNLEMQEDAQQKSGKASKKNDAKTMLILAIIFIICGICGFFSLSENTVDVHTICADEMESGNEYFIDSLYIGDMYGTEYEEKTLMGNKTIQNTTKQYYVAVFMDKEEQMCIASFETGVHGDMREQLEAYLEDETKALGDFELSGYFRARPMREELAKGLKKVVSIYQSELAEIDNSVFEPVYVNLYYIREADYEDYVKDCVEEMYTVKIISILSCIVGFVFAALYLKKAKEEKKIG